MIEEKKQRKNKIIKGFALLGLFLMVFGISYSLFRVTLNSNKTNRIKSGKMSLLLTERNATVKEPEGIAINIEEAIPLSDEEGKIQEDKYEFDILNNGDVDAKYSMYIDVDSSSTIDPSFIKAYLELEGEAVSEPITLGGTTDEKGGYKIETGIVAKTNRNQYTLRLYLKEETELEDVQIDEDTYKEFSAKIRIEGTQLTSVENPYKEGTAAYKIVDDNTVIQKRNSVSMAGFDSTEEAEGLYRYTDTEGTFTYAYRGLNVNNYVSFGGQTWRIVRTLNDGSVRLILDDKIGSGYLSNGVANSFDYYKYDYSNNLDYSTSDIKQTVEDWYSKTISDYDSKIATSSYCNDKSETPNSVASDFYYEFEYTKVYGFYRRVNPGDFDLMERKYNDENLTEEENKELYEKDKKTAKISASITCSDGDKVKAKAALLTVDEDVIAGGSAFISNKNNYLFKSDYTWWTMTPAGFYQTTDAKVITINRYGTTRDYSVDFNSNHVRPVITLKAGVAISGGNGTSTSPYQIS